MATVDIDKVATIIREVAEAIIMPRWRNLADHEVAKKAGSFVTIADHEAEAALAERLSALLPGASVIGEEAVAANEGVLQLFRQPEPVWVIDPIDGTRRFTEGKTAFDVLVALVVGGRSVAGWIYAPAERNFFMGEAGSGVFRARGEGPPERVARTKDLPLADLMGIVGARAFTNRGFADPEAVRNRFRGFTSHMCAGHNYSRLLSGECDFLINFSTLPWDHLAGLALAEEAGLHHARLDGAPFDPLDSKGGILVAPDLASWREILAALLRPA